MSDKISLIFLYVVFSFKGHFFQRMFTESTAKLSAYLYNYIKLKLLCEPEVCMLDFCSAELAQKARREIADYINNGKEERARIRVSYIRTEEAVTSSLLNVSYCSYCTYTR